MNDPLLGQQLLNYRLLEVLGRGSFAVVYRARHIDLDTFVAVKVLHAELGEQERQDFRNEARLLANLRHKHIVRILDYGLTANNRPFLITELAERGALHTIYPHGTQLSLPEVVAYIGQISEALGYAHARHIVHRDVKPENILVDAQDELVLADFGIAKLLKSSGYMSGRAAGTLHYMAPEQIEGQPVPVSDEYALAIMAYEWLTGVFPFQGTATELMAQHLTAKPPSLRQYMPTLPAEVEWVVLTALKKDPGERFETVQAFANALRQAAGLKQEDLNGLKPKRQTGPIGQVSTVLPRRDSSGGSEKPEQSVIRQSGPINRHGQGTGPQPVPSPDPNQSTGGSQNSAPLPTPPPLVLDEQPLPFTSLPGLPKAELTEFWWPTFVIAPDQRRTINLGTLPIEPLTSPGRLHTFPSQSVQLPISATVKSPATIQNLEGQIRRISTPVRSSTAAHAGATTTSAAHAGPGPILRPGPGSQPGTGTPRQSSSQAHVWSTVLTLFALIPGLICTIAAGSTPYYDAGPALTASWIFIFLSLGLNIFALARARPYKRLLGWLIFFLVIEVVTLIINAGLQGRTS